MTHPTLERVLREKYGPASSIVHIRVTSVGHGESVARVDVRIGKAAVVQIVAYAVTVNRGVTYQIFENVHQSFIPK